MGWSTRDRTSNRNSHPLPSDPISVPGSPLAPAQITGRSVAAAFDRRLQEESVTIAFPLLGPGLGCGVGVLHSEPNEGRPSNHIRISAAWNEKRCPARPHRARSAHVRHPCGRRPLAASNASTHATFRSQS